MKELFNHLIQLQELFFALDEHKIAGHENQLEQLEKSVKTLLRKLPSGLSDSFLQLQEREAPAIAPVVDRTCYGCGIELPTSFCAELLHFDKLYQCPSCGRFLYPYQGDKLDLHDTSLRHKLPRLGIERFSSEKLMLPHLQSPDKEGVITELAHLISDQLYFKNPKILIDRALKREMIVSTAVKHSLAFPHVRGVDASCLTVALGLAKKGIKFGAPKNQLTRIIFLIVIPIAASAFYLTLLAGLIEAFNQKEARQTLLGCSEPEELWKTLKKLTRKHIP